MPNTTREFHFELSGNLADFHALIAILRGEKVDYAALVQMNADLKASSALLRQEVEENTPPPVTP